MARTGQWWPRSGARRSGPCPHRAASRPTPACCQRRSSKAGRGWWPGQKTPSWGDSWISAACPHRRPRAANRLLPGGGGGGEGGGASAGGGGGGGEGGGGWGGGDGGGGVWGGVLGGGGFGGGWGNRFL